MTAALPKSDDVYAWAQVHKRMQRERRAKRLAKKPAPPVEETREVNIAELFFDVCLVEGCHALLYPDGSCPFAHERPKHERKACGALHDEPLDFNHPCLFCKAAAE